MIKLSLPIEPVAWQRVKRSRTGVAYVPRETRQFKSAVATHVRTQRVLDAPLIGPIRLIARFILTPPKRFVRAYPSVRPDLDNYLKAVKDALNGVLWTDDGQIVEVNAMKIYAMDGSASRIELELEVIK